MTASRRPYDALKRLIDIIVAAIGLVWLLTQFVVTDRQQIEANVKTMADAVVAGNTDEVFKHVSPDFRYKEMNREQLAMVSPRPPEKRADGRRQQAAPATTDSTGQPAMKRPGSKLLAHRGE